MFCQKQTLQTPGAYKFIFEPNCSMYTEVPVPGSFRTGTSTCTTQNHKMVLVPVPVPLKIPKQVLVLSRYRPKIWYRNTLACSVSPVYYSF